MSGHSSKGLDRFDALNRYASFTDLAALREYSSRPLRRCVRVNTILSSAEELKSWACEQGWQLDPIAWCPEGFFVDREDRSVPLGKDFMHLLGHFYFQEASSMLPVELLQPQPGETVLDMAAAPGSKATQIAAAMQGRGVLIANDILDARIATLKSALQRSGVTNVLITKKAGQWFAKHMTGRFDRVLVDAPCTAQGTCRKDPGALAYCSELKIRKAAKLQQELLEAAVHATKVGGRVVYSTCTLTPEENEQVVGRILNKFSDHLIVLDPEDLFSDRARSKFRTPVEDSKIVQHSLFPPSLHAAYPFLRIWPQTYNTEGFFCAVLEKAAPTRDAEKMEWKRFREKPLSRGRQRAIASFLEERYGVEFVRSNEQLFDKGDHLSLTTEEVAALKLPLVDYCLGLPFGRRLRDIPVYIDHEVAVLRGAQATSNTCTVDDVQLQKLLRGEDVACDESLQGHVLLHYRQWCIGRGRARNGKLKNHLPRWMISHLREVA